MVNAEWDYKIRKHKKVMLCCVEECKDITCSDVEHILIGMGKIEWEHFMGELFVQAIKKAIEIEENEANITKMFSYDLFGFGYMAKYYKSQNEVEAFLFEKMFDIVNETPEQMTVSIKKFVTQ